MIPKIIHYTWFSGEEFPEKIQKCIDSWEKHMPDYELVLWDMNKIREIESDYMAEAIAMKKWAYASDFVRLYAIEKFGGIYLDTDVEVFQSFDSLLRNNAFIGRENSIHYEGGLTERYLTSHCFGAEKGHPFIKACLSYYNGRKFIQSRDKDLPNTIALNMVLLPYIQSEIAKTIGYNPSALYDTEQYLKDGLTIYPSAYFDTKKIEKCSFCIHLAAGSWREYGQYNPEITLRYKIQWRWQKFIQKLLGNKYSVLRLH